MTAELKNQVRSLEDTIADRDRKIQYDDHQLVIKDKAIDEVGIELSAARSEIDKLRQAVFDAQKKWRETRTEYLKLKYDGFDQLGDSDLILLTEISSNLRDRNHLAVFFNNAHKKNLLLCLRSKGYVVGDGKDMALTEKGSAACEYASALGLGDPF